MDNPELGIIKIPDGLPKDINAIIAASVPILLAIAGLVFFTMLLMGGFRYLTAGGDEKATQEARKSLTNAFIGLIIIVASFLITQLLFAVFGLDTLITIVNPPSP